MENEKIVNFPTLSEKDQEVIAETIEEASEKSEVINTLRETEKEDRSEEKGELVNAKVLIKENGEHVVIGPADELASKLSFDDKIKNIGKSINEDDNFMKDFKANPEDVKAAMKDNILATYSNDDKEFTLSEIALFELAKIINAYDPQHDKIKYKNLPDEVKAYIDQYLTRESVSMGTYGSNNFNLIRNEIADELISNMRTSIEIDKFNGEFQSQINNIFDEMNKEISPLFKDYNNSREEYLKKMTESIEDEEKKEVAAAILDAIHESYELTRLIEAAPKTRIKKFDIEKPQRVFDFIHNKYRDSKYHLYDLNFVTNVLRKHLVQNNLIEADDKESAIKVVLLLSKVCMNYDPKIPAEHAFIYYFTYNVILLDVYKGEQYDEYAPGFLNNIMKIVNIQNHK